MSKLSEEEAIRKIVRDEIMLLGLPAGLTTLIRALLAIVRWAQKAKRKLEQNERESHLRN